MLKTFSILSDYFDYNLFWPLESLFIGKLNLLTL